MGSSFAAVKVLIVPAVISLIIFVLLRYVLVPFWRSYHQRYSQYLPLDTFSAQTSSFRRYMQSRFVGGLLVRPAWSWGRPGGEGYPVASAVDGTGGDDDDGEFSSEDGEELASVDQVTWDALESQARYDDHQPRLSRDLEEGFRSDSDDEDAAAAR